MIDKILKLHELGYSKEEIDSIINLGNVEKLPTIDEVFKEETPAEEPKEVETPKIVETKDDSETIERLKTIEDTLKGIQANNIKWSNMPTVTEEKSELEIVQEILGGIKPNGNE